MGAGSVKVVYARWGHLPDRAFRLLAFMALVSKDSKAGETPRYWAGREALAVALGARLPDPDPDDKATGKARRAAFAAVERAISVLYGSGALFLVEHAGPGRNAIYGLDLWADPSVPLPVDKSVDKGVDESSSSMEHPTVGVTNTPRSSAQHPTLSVTTPHAERGPKEERTERIREQEEDLGVRTALTVVDNPRPAGEPSARPTALHVIEGGGADPPGARQPGLWPALVDPPPYDAQIQPPAFVPPPRRAQER